MEPIIYSSYEEIDRQLAILKIERELHYQKAALHLQKAKDAIMPGNLTASLSGLLSTRHSGLVRSIAGFTVVILFRYLLARIKKRHKTAGV